MLQKGTADLKRRVELGKIDQGADVSLVETHQAEARQASFSTARTYAAHRLALVRAVVAMEASRNVSNSELDDLISQFIDHQAASQDKCPSQLLETKHQLNSLHGELISIASEINTTEVQLQVATSELSELLGEEKDDDTWLQQELEKCEKKRQEDVRMWVTLKKELVEMHMIASPGVTMDIPGGQVYTKQAPAAIEAGQQESGKHFPLRAVARLMQTGAALTVAGTPGQAGIAKAQLLVKETGKLSNKLQNCLAGHTTPTDQESCKEVKEGLEQTYVKAYVELTRLVSHYENLVNSTTCEDAARETYKNRPEILKQKEDELRTLTSTLTEKIRSMKTRLEEVKNAEGLLRSQITVLTEKCQAMDDTVSSLDKVRDAIHVLEVCPGMSRAEFHIPVWTGTWVKGRFSSYQSTDAEVDAALNAKCQEVAPGSRAAETSEIEQKTIEGVPPTNTASVPLMGACPNCAGDLDVVDGPQHMSGHSRVCWDPTEDLSAERRRTDCSTGEKAVLCVTDRGDIRRLPSASLVRTPLKFATSPTAMYRQ